MMKVIGIFIFSIAFYMTSNAQLVATPKCPEFNIDILEGTVNKNILPGSTIGQVKLNLPCFSSFEEEGSAAKCGGVVVYKDKDVKFYTTRHYIEIGPDFKGTMTLPLMGAPRDGLFKWLGTAKMKDTNWDAFQTAYGLLILYYNKESKVNKIQFSNQAVNTIKLCE